MASLRKCAAVGALLAFLSLLFGPVRGQEADAVKSAQAFRKGLPVVPLNDTTIVAEAEEFQPPSPKLGEGRVGGWQAKPFGTNYYAATFANAFLSRQAYLGAPEQCAKSLAAIEVQVPKAGKYLALVRYEAAYRFETQFTLQVEQNGKVRLDRLYGARDNVKIWAFRKMLRKEVAWDWGAGENVVWEGHDALVDLEAGKAKLTLIADKQPEPAARRNVDLVMLTSDEAQVKLRIQKENYLPLDGMLTQAGDVHLKVHNDKESASLTLTVPPGTEHSPYWIHMRTWKPVAIKVEPGQASDWVEVGSLLDTLSDGQWNLKAAGKGPLSFQVEVGLRGADGKIETIRRLEKQTGDVALAYFGNTRYSRRIRTADEVLFNLVDYLKKQPTPHGTPPKKTLIFGYTFDAKPGNDKYNVARDEFIKLSGATALLHNLDDATPPSPPLKGGEGGVGLIRGYIDVRGVPTPKLEEYCKKLQADGKADKIACVSLGDEIGLAKPPAKGHAGFRAWLKGKGIKPADLDPAAGADYDKLEYNPGAETAKTKPGLYYYSHIYAYRYGINQLKERTDILRKYLPNAGIGANFSPHHAHMYLGPTHQWISLFREDGMTMPWGEDYIFQVPMGTQQMNSIMVDMFRCAIRTKPERKIHYYVMPHAPNNTTASWRRQFYGDLAHGVKIFNLFEYRPCQAAYTENHVNDPAMYQEVRKAIHELGQFEDIVQDGQVRAADVGLWFSEAADVWNDNRPPFDAAKRCLYILLRHGQIALDMVVEGDDLKPYKTLYLTDQHVSRAASKAIAEWVNAGGHLSATAGAGMFDEFNQPNKVLRELLGVEAKEMEESKDVVRFEKQDLPFAEPLPSTQPLHRYAGKTKEELYGIQVIGLRANFALKGADARYYFPDKSPAMSSKRTGAGEAHYCAFLPGLSYFKPAMPKRPFDRGATDDSLTHFLPTKFSSSSLTETVRTASLPLPAVQVGGALVEATIIESKHGTVIPLINWTGLPIKGLTIRVRSPVPTAGISLASGKPVKMMKIPGDDGGYLEFVFDLDVADALILR